MLIKGYKLPAMINVFRESNVQHGDYSSTVLYASKDVKRIYLKCYLPKIW